MNANGASPQKHLFGLAECRQFGNELATCQHSQGGFSSDFHPLGPADRKTGSRAPGLMSGTPRWVVPEDLREWVPGRMLMRLALDAVDSTEPSATGPDFAKNVEGAAAQRSILTMMVYAYAIGLSDSRELESLAEREPMIQELCGHDSHDWNAVRCLRRRHSERVVCCLARLIGRSWHWMARDRSANGASGSGSGGQGTGRLNQASASDFVAEAQTRVGRAIWADSMAMDD